MREGDGVTRVEYDTRRDSYTPHSMVDREDGRVVTQRAVR